jgi:hypothetical protein
VAVDIILGFDASWTSPEGFPRVNRLFSEWLEGLFRWAGLGLFGAVNSKQ